MGVFMRHERQINASAKRSGLKICWIAVMLLCFVIAVVILAAYSKKYALIFILPICYSLIRLKQALDERMEHRSNPDETQK